MKKYLHFIAAAGLLIPLFVSAEVWFSMAPITCPPPIIQKKWSFFQITASKETGVCTAYFSGGSGTIPVNNWKDYLILPDKGDGYTVGAGRAACQIAACILHISSGAGDSAGVTAARAALAARNAPLEPSLPTQAAMPCFR